MGIDKAVRIVARWAMNIAKNGTAKSSRSSEEKRAPGGQHIQGLNESGGIPSGLLRAGGMEA